MPTPGQRGAFDLTVRYEGFESEGGSAGVPGEAGPLGGLLAHSAEGASSFDPAEGRTPPPLMPC